ncbi:MAG: CoA pyrophosphatase [Lautropia sp.]|nr:CoA pyrophosphatase [Lautropia sp.]
MKHTTPVFNPATAPLLEPVADRTLPARRLQTDWVRQRFSSPPHWQPEVPSVPRQRAETQAAVLVPLLPGPQGLEVVLTVRSQALKKHRGQIAFPGGRIDPEDASVEAAALREAEEEICLPASSVQLLGRLPVHATGTGFCVHPVIGLLDERLGLTQLRPAPDEVDEVFAVPLAFLMDPANHQRRLGRWQEDGQRFDFAFYAMPWQAPGGREYFIWGASAFILRNLYHLLAAD